MVERDPDEVTEKIVPIVWVPPKAEVVP